MQVRRWFARAGFEPVAFDTPSEYEWSVGVHRFVGDPMPLVGGRRLFTFVAETGG